MLNNKCELIQISQDFIPRSNFLTEESAMHLFNKQVYKVPKPFLQYWEYDLIQESKTITILERDQLSCPSKFKVNTNAADLFLRMSYKEFIKVYKDISYEDFCLSSTFINNLYPSLFSTYYHYNNKIIKEDVFFKTIPSNTILYIGEVFSYMEE